MQTEFICLTIMTMFFLVAWLPASIGKWQAFGGQWLASNRKPVVGKELPDWAGRCERAHNNLKDNFPGFIVAILALAVLGKMDQSTSIAAIIYVVSRFGHFATYGAGNVLGRAIFFFGGLFSNFYLLIKILI